MYYLLKFSEGEELGPSIPFLLATPISGSITSLLRLPPGRELDGVGDALAVLAAAGEPAAVADDAVRGGGAEGEPQRADALQGLRRTGHYLHNNITTVIENNS